MRRWVAFLLFVLTLGPGTPVARAQCWGCSEGCAPSVPGLAFCRSGITPLGPTCVTWGACALGTDGTGDDPIGRRPRPRATAAARTRSLTVYETVTRLSPDAARSREWTDAWVVARAAIPPTLESLELAIEREGGPSAGRGTIVDAGVLVAAGRVAGAWRTASGSGYALTVVARSGAAEILVCALSGSAATPLATFEVGYGDALVVPLRLDGRPCLLTLAPVSWDAPVTYGAADARSPHAPFLESAARRVALADRSLTLTLDDSPDARCE